MSPRRNAIVALALGLSAGAALPVIQVFIECRAEASEACVWGKSLLPLTISISSVLIGGIFALAIFGVLEARRPPADDEKAE